MALLEHFKTSLWGPPSANRSLITKLDLTLLPYFSLIWFLSGVNRAS
jgi:ACS family pantothenate transporter-like MFS transporter